MSKTRNVFLIGPMGAGKTTIGRQLARNLNLEFYDSDQVIEAQSGANIPWIFELEGELGFRKREAKVIKELAELSGIVLATGGGAVLDDESRTMLTARGVVVYLHTPINEQLYRITHKQNRPLIAEKDSEVVFKELYATREPVYRETAHLIYDTSQYTVKTITEQIHRDLQKSYYF